MKKGRIALLVCPVFCAFLAFSCYAIPKTVFNHRFIYTYLDNLGRKRWLDTYRDEVTRASASGYNGIFVSMPLADMKRNTTKIRNTKMVKEMLAWTRSKGFCTIPQDIGHQTARDYDTTQSVAIPVKGTRFKVHGGVATVNPDHSVGFKNGELSAGTNNKPNHWGLQGNGGIPGTQIFMRNGCLHIEKPTGRIGFVQSIDGLKPWRAYELSVFIRTEGYTGARLITFDVFGTSAPERPYLLLRRGEGFGGWGVSQNLGTFTKYSTDFNSMENTSAKVILVVSRMNRSWRDGGSAGKAWFKNVSIREVGLYETIRRPSLPYKLCSEDGTTVYEEGKDYELVLSAALLNAEKSRPLGQKILIPEGSRIADGQFVCLDWWQHGNMEHVRSPSEHCSPRAWDIVKLNMENGDEMFACPEYQRPPGWFLPWSEYRVGFWDPACTGQYKTAGEYIGSTIARISNHLKEPNTNRQVFVWSDMLDPYHNASDNYPNSFMINGNLHETWKSLPKDLIVVPWWQNAKKVRFYAGLDPKYPSVHFRQVLTCYDPSSCAGYEKIINELEAEAKKPLGISGVMFSTEHYGNKNIEAVARYWKTAGRWGQGPIVWPEVGVKEKTFKKAVSPITIQGTVDGVLSYAIGQNTHVRLSLVDAQGRTVKTLENGMKKAGSHEFRYAKQGLAAGVYVARLEIQGSVDQISGKQHVHARVVVF